MGSNEAMKKSERDVRGDRVRVVREDEIRLSTGRGEWHAEVLPGFFVETSRPGVWCRFWLFVLFGIRFNSPAKRG